MKSIGYLWGKKNQELILGIEDEIAKELQWSPGDKIVKEPKPDGSLVIKKVHAEESMAKQ